MSLEDDLPAERELTASLHHQLSRTGQQRNDATRAPAPGSQHEG